MATKNYLDKTGLAYFWGKITALVSGKQDTLVSGTNIKTINGSSVLGSGDITVGGTSTNSKLYYGICDTKGTLAAKVVTCSGFVLETGVHISVKFNYANTYNGTSTLNVNSTGAINITSVGTTTTTRYFWNAGEVIDFIYDGTNFVMVRGGTATTTYYGLTKLSSSTSDTSTTLAATPSAVKAAYDLADGKQDPATTLAGYGITDAYTKTEADGLLDDKQDVLKDQNNIVQCAIISGTTGSTLNAWNAIGTLGTGKTILSIHGRFTDGGSSYCVPFVEGSNTVSLYYNHANGKIHEKHNYAYASSRSIVVVVQYY